MRGSRLTFNGFMQYDPTFLDGISIPSGLDRKVLANEIIMKSYDLELVYPSYDFMKTMLERFTAARLWGWQKLYDTTMLEYNPIWNKDGTITETETRDLAHSETGSRDDLRKSGETSTENGNESRTETSESGTVGSTNAFNTGTWADRDKSDTDTSGSSSGLYSTNTKRSEDDSFKSSDKRDGTETGTVTRERIEQGNIGVMSTQSMIQEEREIAEFSIYEKIADDIVRAFCILVY